MPMVLKCYNNKLIHKEVHFTCEAPAEHWEDGNDSFCPGWVKLPSPSKQSSLQIAADVLDSKRT